jgi:hypothetical protein
LPALPVSPKEDGDRPDGEVVEPVVVDAEIVHRPIAEEPKDQVGRSILEGEPGDTVCLGIVATQGIHVDHRRASHIDDTLIHARTLKRDPLAVA